MNGIGKSVSGYYSPDFNGAVPGLNTTSQGAKPEDARQKARIRRRSRKLVRNAG